MEKPFSTSKDLKSSNNQSRSTGQEKSGKKTLQQRIEEGRQWREEKIKQGYEETPYGLLSKQDIREGGFLYDITEEEVYNRETGKFEQKQVGYNSIPSQEYIREVSDGRNFKGSKFIGPSQKFLAWLHKKKLRDAGLIDVEEEIEKEIQKATPIQKELIDEIDINNIVF